MSVAAYASVLSLLRVVDNIQHPSRLRFFPDTTQIDALREKLSFLQDFLEVHSSTITEDVVESTVRKIPQITRDAEILIDNYVVDHLYRELELYSVCDEVHRVIPTIVGPCNTESFRDEMHRVMQDIALINEALTSTPRTIQHDQGQPRFGSVPSLTTSGERNTVVGFDDQMGQVLEMLIGNQRDLVIVPIVGMGGIGKTTLARSVFDHPYNLEHFDVRIWLTISQDYSVKKVILGLLKDGVLGDKRDTELDSDKSEGELITQLYQKLLGQRYLIVLDDVWSVEAWYDLKRGFPNNGKRSRVMVTTRLCDIANSLDSRNNNIHSMKFLDEDKSWELFSEKAFGKGGRSLELEEIGREISYCCNGLPLLLVVIGGLLANSNMTVENWQTVARDINSLANSAYDEYCLRILSLSYHHLPIHLKACFLYTRHLEEDSDIKVSKLIKSWVVHGIVKPMRGKRLEEAARIYLEDLIGRNMLLVRERGKHENIKICGIHDLLRDLSIKISNEEQLFELPRTVSVIGCDSIKKECAVCNERKTDMTTLYPEIHDSMYDEAGVMLVCSSCEGTLTELARPSRFVAAVELKSQSVMAPTTCRWIDLFHSGISIYDTICLIWNLEFLDIADYGLVLLEELWNMPQLRHVKIRMFALPDRVSTDVIVLENLHTLMTVGDFKFTEDIVRSVPNLRKLGLRYYHFPTDKEEAVGWSCFYLQNLAHLRKLESLTIDFLTGHPMDLKKGIAFPCSLKELNLFGCRIVWEDLTIIGSSLPNLQVLKLRWKSVLGEEWNNPIEGEELLFPRLKYLQLRELHLVRWRVDDETPQFPALETLVLVGMLSLDAIPQEIGELPSLKSIYLCNCRERIVDSARAIVEEQLRNGDEGKLVVHVENLGERRYQLGGAC